MFVAQFGCAVVFEERSGIARDYRLNHLIRVPEVRLIGSGDGSDGGESVVMDTRDALELARERGLDLVEVGPNQSPPVVKLLDYGRFKFVQAKKAKEARKSQAKTELRSVRLSPKIGQHDIEAKIRKVRELLGEGAKVRVFVRMRGRENQHPEVAVKVLRRVAESVASEAKLEKAPTVEQRAISIVLAPGGGQPVGAASGSGESNAKD
jgi:translation initiation factor IF-3